MTTTPLLEQLLVLLSRWQRVFRQERSFQRALRLALAHILTPGQRLLSRLIATSAVRIGTGRPITSSLIEVLGKWTHCFLPSSSAALSTAKSRAIWWRLAILLTW